MIPSEGHSYRARESIMHVLAEQDAWLEAHVKHAKASEAPADDVDVPVADVASATVVS